MIRKQRIVIGRKVWVEQFHSPELPTTELPEGLSNGARVKVIAYDSAAKLVTVEAGEHTWTLDPIHIDTGWSFQLEGRAFAENTLQAKAYVKSLIADLRAQPDHPRFPELRQHRIDALLAILARNSRRKLTVTA